MEDLFERFEALKTELEWRERMESKIDDGFQQIMTLIYTLVDDRSKKLLTPAQAAALLNIDVKHFTNRIGPKIPGRVKGKPFLYPMVELLKYKEQTPKNAKKHVPKRVTFQDMLKRMNTAVNS